MRPEVATRWLAYSESDLAVARGVDRPGVLTETLCFHAQQAAEKAVKAVLVAEGAEPPRTHDLEVLLAAVPGDVPIGFDRAGVAALTVYAVASRYPGDDEPVDADEYAAALAIAVSVVTWARLTLSTLLPE
jgi:HEPN domain-containing protein